jgi:hypothetical protein
MPRVDTIDFSEEMHMDFDISGLDPQRYAHLFSLSDAELAAQGIDRHIADAPLGFPCRVTLCDAAVGEQLLLLNHQHLPEHSPYQANGPIFVRRAAVDAPSRAIFRQQLPPALAQAERLFSVRAYDAHHRMRDAEVASGAQLAAQLERFLADQQVAYLHIHFARRGCYVARVDRSLA